LELKKGVVEESRREREKEGINYLEVVKTEGNKTGVLMDFKWKSGRGDSDGT